MKYLCMMIVVMTTMLVSAQTTEVSDDKMKEIYEEVKTPYKFGLVVVPEHKGMQLDCPSIYKMGKKWMMTYIVFDGKGYETWLAESDDLVNWKTLGRQLSRGTDAAWDATQKAGYNSLIDMTWGGSYILGKFKKRYWMSYFGGSSEGYEPEPLSIGIAYTDRKPSSAFEWKRLIKPVLSSSDPDVGWWENRNKLFKSYVIEDKQRHSGARFIMYYNAVGDSLANNKPTRWYERIGMAVSDDMQHWKRYQSDPIVHHPVGITGDPMIQKIGELYVMFYFGAFWKDRQGAFNRFAVSKDLIHWTDWKGENLIESSEAYDALYAHKSFVIKHKGVVYHYYCAVDKDGNRGLALATSKDIGKSQLTFVKERN